MILYTTVSILAIWLILTLWAESEGKAESFSFGNPSSAKKMLIVYDPDPFYDLDKKVCTAFGQTLAENGVYATVTSVAATHDNKDQYDNYVFCANTYNWRPDWAVTGFIKKRTDLQAKGVVAITLGAGSTESSQKALEALLVSKQCKILSSNSLWLMRPNDESKLKESNVSVAESIARTWAAEIAARINSDSPE